MIRLAAKDDAFVDSIGVGYNFTLHLHNEGFRVNLINVGEEPQNTDRRS